MRNTIRQILFLFLILGIQACSKDEGAATGEDEKTFTIKTFYCTNDQPNFEKPDAGARVYIYYGVFTVDFSNGKYLGDGQILKNDSVIVPDQKYSIDFDGTVYIDPTYSNRKISVIVESNYYKNRFASTSFQNFDKSIICNFIFRP